jgi:hypothetical protein
MAAIHILLPTSCFPNGCQRDLHKDGQLMDNLPAPTSPSHIPLPHTLSDQVATAVLSSL